MNCINLMGNLTRDVELKTTSTGKVVGAFTIAVPRKMKRDETDFINCVVWQKTAEIIAKYFSKGSKIAVTGELQTRNYEDKDGKKVYVSEIVVNDFYFCESKRGETSADSRPTKIEDDTTDLPFDL